MALSARSTDPTFSGRRHRRRIVIKVQLGGRQVVDFLATKSSPVGNRVDVGSCFPVVALDFDLARSSRYAPSRELIGRPYTPLSADVRLRVERRKCRDYNTRRVASMNR